MKVMRMLMAVILSLITFGCDNAPESVSVYDLKNRPDHWNNKEIVVWGYAVITGEFEDSGYIWQSKEDAAKKDLAPTVTIGDLSEKYPKRLSENY